jgi:outer membrane protein assembly factor BamD
MFRRLLSITVVALLAFSLAACHNKRATNPIANVDSKQPDKVLFDRAMDMLKHNKFDQARLTLQTLINTYPDSEFIARAKLGIADSWYDEGGTAAWAQAEAEYNDFRTFFPNMPEAAEAQMKVGNIHYQQMEKPDRDFTHAKRAEDAYRQMILEYPDSKLLPQAKERLREVQEVLAEREFRVGRFYYLRESYPAAIARLKSVADTYPLYSGAEDALYMIGDSYEGQIRMIRANRLIPEAMKGKFIKEWTDGAADAYSRIVTRYPVTGRADDARKRLAELKRPIPTPTQEAIAQNKSEEDSRQKLGMWARAMLNFHKRPDVAEASAVGDPSLADAKPTNAPDLVKQAASIVTSNGATGAVTVEKATGVPGPNQPVPRSDQPAAQPQDQTQQPAAQPTAQPGAAQADQAATAAQPDQSPAATGIPELTPMNSAPGTTATQTTPPQANPAATEPTGSTPAPPPPQVNEIKNSGAAATDASAGTATTATQGSTDQSSDKDKKKESSSKKKKKKFKVF